MQLAVNSEIGRLRAVLVHTPANEVENMTPSSASDVLYDDILSLPLALREHAQLTGVLGQVAEVYQLRSVLGEVLNIPVAREEVVLALTELYRCREYVDQLTSMPSDQLTHQLIEGTTKDITSLARFLDPSPYVIPPLPNAFFTRDATMCLNDGVIIGSMAYPARVAESILLRAVFKHHPTIKAKRFFFDGTTQQSVGITIEGGDLLVLREDLILIGYSERTSVQAIDMLMEAIVRQGPVRNFIVVKIPKQRASIHLDMLFTMVDVGQCVVYPPMLKGSSSAPAFHCVFGPDSPSKMAKVVEYGNVLQALKSIGMDLEPIPCGGGDRFHQEREQWSSGANFFAFAPGQVMGYAHNIHTIEAMSGAGFQVVHAKNVLDGSRPIGSNEKILVTMEGSELSRGGGGCRCMTMPLARDEVT